MAFNSYEAMQERCSNCSYCKWIPFDKVKDARFAENCPSICYHGFNTYSARGRFQFGLAVNRGELSFTESGKDIAASCLSCGACDVACKICRYNLEPLEHNIALKEASIDAAGMLPAQREMEEALRTEQTMLPGKKKADRKRWYEGLNVKFAIKEPAEVLFFPGCQYCYTPELWDKSRLMVELLQKSGADVGILGEADVCCGGRAHQQGMRDLFNERAGNNIALFEKIGIRAIVTPCADCYHAFKRQYARLGLHVEVLHISEYLAKVISEGKLVFSKELNLTVTYHDPCHLGRLGENYVQWSGKEKKILNQIHTWEPRRPRYNGAHGIYDAPRDIIHAIPGVELKEMHRIREYSWCCGAGGGCSETKIAFSEWTAEKRIDEALETGAQAIVTACPWCCKQLASGKNKNGELIEVIELTELVRRAL